MPVSLLNVEVIAPEQSWWTQCAWMVLLLFSLFIKNLIEKAKQLLVTFAADSEIEEVSNDRAGVTWWDGLTCACLWKESPCGCASSSEVSVMLARWETSSVTPQLAWDTDRNSPKGELTAWCRSLKRECDPWAHKQGAGMEERERLLCVGHSQDRYWASAPSSGICTLQRVLQDDKGKEKSRNDVKTCLTVRHLRSIIKFMPVNRVLAWTPASSVNVALHFGFET